MNVLYKSIGIILDRTRHAANIGSVCRVMKNLGYKNLHIVSPTMLGHLSSIMMIQGAEDLLENSKIHDSLEDAVSSYHVVFATSRRMKQDTALELREGAKQIADMAKHNRVAILFGSEKYGLKRKDVDRCGGIIRLPVVREFPSVNLAQSVAMVCMELKLRIMEEFHSETTSGPPPEKINLSLEERRRFYEKFSALFAQLGFDSPAIYNKLQNIFDRANLSKSEKNLFYGLIKEVRRLI
ncbi:MAG: tRNA (cytidine/uridine-2'-O-)-methyltransferase TrmJ [bacterium]|nr:MAG: tRNA (cytidine/uridine-2'-O-)-methyltransferase TrmJ [bacterium]